MDMNKVLADFIRQVVKEELDKRLADLRVVQGEQPVSKDTEFDFSDVLEDDEEEKDVGWDGYPKDNGWDDDDCALPVSHEKTPKGTQHEKQILRVWSGTTELSDQAGVHPSTIRNWIYLGFLSHAFDCVRNKYTNIALSPDCEDEFRDHLYKYFRGYWDNGMIEETIETIKNG